VRRRPPTSKEADLRDSAAACRRCFLLEVREGENCDVWVRILLYMYALQLQLYSRAYMYAVRTVPWIWALLDGQQPGAKVRSYAVSVRKKRELSSDRPKTDDLHDIVYCRIFPAADSEPD
jgi:hypothetical protein